MEKGHDDVTPSPASLGTRGARHTPTASALEPDTQLLNSSEYTIAISKL